MFRSSRPVVLLLSCSRATLADEAKKDPPKPEAKPAEKKEEPKKDDKKEESSVTHGSVTIGGKEVMYKATAAMLPILKADGNPSAQVFHIAYTKEGADAKTRPVTFASMAAPVAAACGCIWVPLVRSVWTFLPTASHRRSHPAGSCRMSFPC